MPKEEQNTAFSGTVMDSQLIQFETKCKENQRTYYSQYPHHSKLEILFITPEERTKYNKIDNKTNAKIAKFIEQIIQVRIISIAYNLGK